MKLKKVTVEHQEWQMGMDVVNPRFAWILESSDRNVKQTGYRIRIFADDEIVADTRKIESDSSIENEVSEFTALPMTEYQAEIDVWDNYGNQAEAHICFETGRLDTPWEAVWVEPEQTPTPMPHPVQELSAVAAAFEKDFSEFMPVQLLRVPIHVEEGIRKARIYMSAHGIYRLSVNGVPVGDGEFAPDFTAYQSFLQYQTYDITETLSPGENVAGIMIADGWWSGRIGMSGESCQYGDKLGILFEARLTYRDGRVEVVTGDRATSSTGPVIYSDIFVGEKYDATKEMPGWDTPSFDGASWKPVNRVDYPMDNLTGQSGSAVSAIRVFEPKAVLRAPNGDMLVDAGQVLTGLLEFTVDAPSGTEIRMEHSEILDENGNFFNNIMGNNKDQTDYYITKEGKQTYRPLFTFHGFRYVRISGWPCKELCTKDFRIHVLSSAMEDIGSFRTSDEKLNRLQENIWWSQVSNTLSIPTDCPQRERAGWTGDIMAFAPTMCFNRNADTFLSRWMKSLRAEQLENGEVPMVVPYINGYKTIGKMMGYYSGAAEGCDTSSGWGDAVLRVPLAVYKAYGDRRILEDNYGAMKKWLDYIEERAANHHPAEYETWDEVHRERSRFLWNTDFHYGDWLIPSMVIGKDATHMMDSALATRYIVAPAYFAFSAQMMKEVCEALGHTKEAEHYGDLYKKIREAFIEEYIREDGTAAVDLQGVYVICLKIGLVPDDLRQAMVNHLCELIAANHGCLDTGFLSVLFLMDALCENGREKDAFRQLFQNQCPGWMYEIEHGATTLWESWGAISEEGKVSTYSYNHYAFGCVGDWLYREIGGLQAAEPGYKKIRIAPRTDCGLKDARVTQRTPYGEASVCWRKSDGRIYLDTQIPANTSAEIILPGMEQVIVGSGTYHFETATD